MKIKLVVTFIVILTYYSVFSQGVFPSIEDHPVWYVQRSISPGLPGPVFLMSYHLEKDTILNQKRYSLVSRTGNKESGRLQERIGFVRSDSKKVFFKQTPSGKEYMLYDFGMRVGDKAYCPFLETDSARYEVIKVDSVNVNGIKRLRLKVLPEYYPEEYMSMYWIEGIGALWNPFYHDVFGVGGVSDEVRCVSVDTFQLYENPNYDDCITVLKKTDFIVNNGVVWSGMNIYKDRSGKDSVASYHVRFEGDTILNNKTYSKIWQSNDSLGINWKITGLIREVDKQVYYRQLGYDGLHDLLLYNFSIEIGNSLLLESTESQGFFESMGVINRDSIEVNGIKRLRIEVSDGKNTDIWIEKIGSVKGILNRGYKGTDTQKLLLCVQDNGNTIYNNESYSNCFYTQKDWTNNRHVSFQNEIAVYPNPVRDNLFVDNNRGKQVKLQIKILDANGHIVYSKIVSEFHNTIDVSMIPLGFYFIQVTSNNLIVNEKIIKQ